ncbi:MAG: hypothetical protein ACYCYO_14530 [Bacilli bacterium]
MGMVAKASGYILAVIFAMACGLIYYHEQNVRHQDLNQAIYQMGVDMSLAVQTMNLPAYHGNPTSPTTLDAYGVAKQFIGQATGIWSAEKFALVASGFDQKEVGEIEQALLNISLNTTPPRTMTVTQQTLEADQRWLTNFEHVIPSNVSSNCLTALERSIPTLIKDYNSYKLNIISYHWRHGRLL